MSDFREELVEPTKNSLTYDNYLKVTELLELQVPLSEPAEHDETLFILIHQVYELWFKQILHEIDYCEEALQSDQLLAFLKSMKRISAIQETLTKQIDILETMTPNDFNRFRERLNPASGFQSFQFRYLEFKLGAKYKEYLKFHKSHDDNHKLLKVALEEPSLYDVFLSFLSKRGYRIPVSVLTRDYTQAYEANEEITNLFTSIYQDPDKHYEVYLALETLADLEQKFLLWRYRHVAMVSRMIGNNRGTGGSSGVKYLSNTLNKRFFPEVWDLRNQLTGGAAYGNSSQSGDGESSAVPDGRTD